MWKYRFIQRTAISNASTAGTSSSSHEQEICNMSTEVAIIKTDKDQVLVDELEDFSINNKLVIFTKLYKLMNLK